MQMNGNFFGILIVLVIIALYVPQVFTQTWSTEIYLEQSGSPTTHIPDFDIDPNTGHLHIVSMIDPNGVLYTEMDQNGNVLKQSEIDVAANDAFLDGNAFGATIAVDSQGRPHVCFRQVIKKNVYSSFYTYWNGTGWASPITLSSEIERGYMLRMDVDQNDKVHIARGSMAGNAGEELVGPVKYFRFNDFNLENSLDDISRFRADDRLELDASYENEVHMILGCPDYEPDDRTLWYWRSFNGGESWTQSEIYSTEYTKDANGSPDLFVDASGNVHIVYGSETDRQLDGTPSVRYIRFTNNQQIMDVPITVKDEVLDRYDTPQGIGSVAASNDGQIVIVAYSEDFGARLFTRESHDGGATWSDRTLIAASSCFALGRDRQVIRAIRDKFYLMYPTPSGVRLVIKKFTVNNAPLANAGGPYQGDEGGTISFNASQSTDQENNISYYEWDFQNDGVWDETTTSPTTSFTYTDDFSGQVKVRVVDEELESDTATASVTISNVSPTADAGGPYSASLGGTVQFHATAQDPGDDVLTYKWDLDDDGIFETSGQDAQKTYNSGGQYTVRVQVTDDDGGVGTDTAPVSVAANPPVLQTISNQTIAEGGQFTAIDLAAVVSDADHTDEQITWAFQNTQNLQVTQVNQKANIAVIDPEWSGSEEITFVATDPTQLSASTKATFTVTPVNDPPVVKAISVASINEGSSFSPISLDNYVTDPDNQKSEIVWKASGQQSLVVDIDAQQRIATVSPPTIDWFGSENVTFKATDQNGQGLSDQTTTTFTVQAVNDPPEITKNPGQTIRNNQTFTPVWLDSIVTDVDNSVESISWSFSGNDHLLISITNRRMTIEKPSADWFGSDDIILKASDGQLSDQITVVFTAIYENEPPVISGLEGETISENGHFTTVSLDSKVADPSNNDDELTWTVSGNLNLQISGVEERMLYITVPDTEWAGSETLAFKVSDPGGMTATTTAVFTVTAVNDAPQLSAVPDFTFDEDTTLTIQATQLQVWATDVDNSFNELQFYLKNNTHVHANYQTQFHNLTFSADEDWSGVEQVLFAVQDEDGAATSKSVKITVNPRPDAPKPFALLEPENAFYYETKPASIQFTWEQTVDPDPGETAQYFWELSREKTFDTTISEVGNLTSPSYFWQVPENSSPGWYFWRVTAYDANGNMTLCTSHNVFILEKITDLVEELGGGEIPEEFALLPNYPNPFNPETMVTFHLPQREFVKITVYNSLGQLIQTLVNADLPAGIHTTFWNGKKTSGDNASSGIYLLRIQAGEFQMTRKMMLLQ